MEFVFILYTPRRISQFYQEMRHQCIQYDSCHNLA